MFKQVNINPPSSSSTISESTVPRSKVIRKKQKKKTEANTF
jgi:hypothetical protein